jgi:hypothetical protein
MIKLVQTCYACPEQYEAYLDDKEIGYLRLRHGRFYCEYLPTRTIVYQVEPYGDGIFDDNERNYHLNRACEALENASKGILPGTPEFDKPEEPIFFEMIEEIHVMDPENWLDNPEK